ncbi:phosphate regulon sensor kinase PhoR [Mizugakiibacter sediminis]|uniref:Phosphate regulon sensor protein PhoR n=2 Tax=Mizugakiibacter sediminis TaxID=1475481 RepID=A0A0K8QR75_9GAMM|nr:phosphate regulon sensor histidine kinase PhoR [Mizugakiibacter sediminis]GAP67444.1 phosphate regulon sensor kinase PhoR [Mizugakiibacter sediminis]
MPARRTTVLALALAAALALAWGIGRALGHPAAAVALTATAALAWTLRRLAHEEETNMTASARVAAELTHERTRLSRARRLAAQMRALRSAAGALPDGVVLLDANGRVRWFNRAAERLLGLAHPNDRGVDLVDRLGAGPIGPWLRQAHDSPLNEVPAPGDPDVQVSLARIPLPGGERLLMVRDISALTRLEQIRRDFVANVSHELRTPLTVIHGYLELLEPEDVPALAPVLAEMRTQSKRMGQIVEDLLTLSRLETQERLPEERVAMAPLLATLRREAEALSQGRHRIGVESADDADLRGSPKDLHSAFSNLVSNAVRYTPTGGRIAIRWSRTSDGAVFAVSDTGYGIPAQHIPRLTERFYRVSSSRSRETGGTGLGLSIVKHVLALHDARLEIASEPGKGSTFACVFGAERVLEPGVEDG